MTDTTSRIAWGRPETLIAASPVRTLKMSMTVASIRPRIDDDLRRSVVVRFLAREETTMPVRATSTQQTKLKTLKTHRRDATCEFRFA